MCWEELLINWFLCTLIPLTMICYSIEAWLSARLMPQLIAVFQLVSVYVHQPVLVPWKNLKIYCTPSKMFRMRVKMFWRCFHKNKVQRISRWNWKAFAIHMIFYLWNVFFFLSCLVTLRSRLLTCLKLAGIIPCFTQHIINEWNVWTTGCWWEIYRPLCQKHMAASRFSISYHHTHPSVCKLWTPTVHLQAEMLTHLHTSLQTCSRVCAHLQTFIFQPHGHNILHDREQGDRIVSKWMTEEEGGRR